MSTGLNIDALNTYYGDYHAVKNVTLDIAQGEFVVIVGPSGCGKSTLLRSIAGLETTRSGSIVINGQDVTHAEPSQRGVAMVFQNYALYPHMTVAQNMGFSLKVAGEKSGRIKERVAKAAEILQITEHLNKKPKHLSGGQRQRVAIGRAITRSPDVFLFDEPLSNLDAALRTQMRIQLRRLHDHLKATMIYVTHDQIEALTMADRIVVMNQGVVQQMGTPLDLYNRPVNQFVAGFMGSPKMNFFKAAMVSADPENLVFRIEGQQKLISLAKLSFDIAPAVGNTVVFGIRPERLSLSPHGVFRFKTKVSVVEQLGREMFVLVDAAPIVALEAETSEGLVGAYFSGQRDLKTGDTITLSASAESLYVFDENGHTLRAQSPDLPTDPR